MQLMSQLQAQVPHPLRDDLPQFLPTGRVRAPAVGILFLVFIGQGRGVSPTMQLKGHDIGRGETVLRQAGEEKGLDQARAGVTHPALPSLSRISLHTAPAALPPPHPPPIPPLHTSPPHPHFPAPHPSSARL